MLSLSPCGVPSAQLVRMLHEKLSFAFDYTLFSCCSFEEYLVKYAENYADVMIKVSGCIVYPKGG